MSKQTAINLVNRFAAEPSSPIWPAIDKAALANGLIVRINDPNQIDQRGTPLCGAASVVRAVAMSNPDGYAQAAIDLYRNGRANIGNLSVTPGSELRRSAAQNGADPADWILLASLRDSDNWFFSPAGWFGSNLAGVTLPGTIEDWFTRAGYTDIINITYLAFKPIPSVLAMEAHRASNLYSRGYKVLIFIDSNMLDSAHQDDLISAFPDHWIALDSTISDRGIIAYDSPVSFNVFSWGRILSVPVNPGKPLLKRDFLHMYYGFIAAKG